MIGLIILVIIGIVIYYKLHTLKDTGTESLSDLICDKPAFVDLGLGRCLSGTYNNQCADAATTDYNGHNYFVCDYHSVLNDFELLENEVI